MPLVTSLCLYRYLLTVSINRNKEGTTDFTDGTDLSSVKSYPCTCSQFKRDVKVKQVELGALSANRINSLDFSEIQAGMMTGEIVYLGAMLLVT